MKNNGVSNAVLGIIIFVAMFLLVRTMGCSACTAGCVGCIACTSCTGCVSGAGGRTEVSSGSCYGSSAENTSSPEAGHVNLVQKDELYVNDYTGLVSEEAKSSIVSMGSRLEDSCGAQLAVVVINDSSILGNSELQDFTYKLFNTWGVGSKNNDGVLLVINTAACTDYTGNAWCIIGTGLEKLLHASDVGEIIDDQVFPSLDEGRVSDAALNGYTALYQKLTNILGG